MDTQIPHSPVCGTFDDEYNQDKWSDLIGHLCAICIRVWTAMIQLSFYIDDKPQQAWKAIRKPLVSFIYSNQSRWVINKNKKKTSAAFEKDSVRNVTV